MNNWRPRYWLPVPDTLRLIVAIILAIIIILLLLRACNTVTPTLVGPSAAASPVTGQPIDLSGTAAPNAVVSVFDGDTLIGQATADANGNWKLTLPAGLGVGAHQLTARVFRDKTQVASSAPLGLSIAALPATPVPTAAPAPTQPPAPTALPPTEAPRPTPTPMTPSISAPVAGAVLTADKPGDVVGSAAPGSKVQVWDGDKLLGEVTADSNGKWSFGLPSSLLAGTHALKSVALDASGKEAARSPAVTIEIKSIVAPTILPIANGQLAIGSVVKGKAQPGSVVSIFDGDKLLGTANAGADGSWEFALPASLQAGTVNLRAAILSSTGAVLGQSDVMRVQITPAVLPASGGTHPEP